MILFYRYKNYGTHFNNEYFLDDNDDTIFYLKLENKRDGVQYAIFDKEDFDKIKVCNWKLRKDSLTFYCLNSKKGFVHRFIMNCPNDKQIDHINGNGLDNRKSNLRIVTNQENSLNKRNAIGIYIATDNRKKKYRVIWKENQKQKTKGFESYDEALDFREKIEKDVYHRPQVK